jgi:archaeosortase B (VPXXXP-CTERM-specific)
MPGSFRRAVSNSAYAFVARFALLLAALALLYPIATRRWFFAIEALNAATARVQYLVLRAFGADASLEGNLVRLGGFGVRIIEECTGIFEAIIFTAAVLAFPTSLAKKALGIALGVPLLYLFNVARILVLLVVGRTWPARFELMHLYFWQATLILMITSVWLLWIFKVVRHAPRTRPDPG